MSTVNTAAPVISKMRLVRARGAMSSTEVEPSLIAPRYEPCRRETEQEVPRSDDTLALSELIEEVEYWRDLGLFRRQLGPGSLVTMSQPTDSIRRTLAQAASSLPLHDTQDFDDAAVGSSPVAETRRSRAADGRVVWDLDAYDFLRRADARTPRTRACGARVSC